MPHAVNDCPRHATGDVTIGMRIDPRTGDSECAGCYADRLEDDQRPATFARRPAPADARELIVQALRPATSDAATEATG